MSADLRADRTQEVISSDLCGMKCFKAFCPNNFTFINLFSKNQASKKLAVFSVKFYQSNTLKEKFSK